MLVLSALLLHVATIILLFLFFTLLCLRARALSGHAAQRDSCHAQLCARHYCVTVTVAAPVTRVSAPSGSYLRASLVVLHSRTPLGLSSLPPYPVTVSSRLCALTV